MIAEIIIAALLVIGGVFGLIGSWGLIRLPDIMTRLHAPTKATTVGVGSALIAAMIWAASRGQPFGRELLITLFLLLTAPISALFIAKTVIHRNTRPEDLPPGDWATRTRGADTGRPELQDD